MLTCQADALPQMKRKLRGRRLVAVDIENVVGGAILTSANASWARHQIEKVIELRYDEQVVIGTSHIGVVSTRMGWDGPRIVMRSGPDGADLALLEVLQGERIAERFDELVLVSGDGIFAEVVARLAAEGVKTTVVAHHGGLSKRLRLAAANTFLFERNVAGLGGAA